MATTVIGSSATSTSVIPPTGGAGVTRTSRRKQRCWLFEVQGVTNSATEVELIASVRERYTTVKRLVVRATPSNGGRKNLVVEVQFTGPQPSEGPGGLLCDLLGGTSVDAKPVELPRGRKKRPRTDAASSEASDSDIEDGVSRKMGGHRSTSSLPRMGEEAEDGSLSSGACTTVARPGGGDKGRGDSPIIGGKTHDAAPFRLSAGHESGIPVAPSSTMASLTSAGMFKSPSTCDGSSLISASSRVVVPADDGSGRALPLALQPTQHRVVSSDGALPPSQQQEQQSSSSMQQQQIHALQQQHRQQQFSRPAVTSGTHWEDVVGRMTTPQNSGHSLEIDSVDLSSNGSQPSVKSEMDPLLINSSTSLGAWNSNDSQVALLGPLMPPQSSQPPLRWSFDSAQVADNSAGSTVVDLSDVDSLLRASTESEGNAAAPASAAEAASPSPSPSSSTSAAVGAGVTDSNDDTARSRVGSADAGAGRQQHQRQQDTMQMAKWASDGPMPMEKVVIEPSRKECDFEGRPSPTSDATNVRVPVSASSDRQCHLVFTGLENTGQDLRTLRVTAHFGVDGVHKVGKVTSPIQIGSNGRAYSGVFYPSMQEIWPELYNTSNIRVIEVDLVIEIRSDNGEYQYVGPQLKVTYLRAAPPADSRETQSRPSGRRTASRAPIPLSNDGTQVSYSCVDYSCGDWFSDICQSVFRGGANAHQPLAEDPNDLMNVDP